MKRILSFTGILFTFIILSCVSPTPPAQQQEETTKTVAVHVPEFNGDSAYNFVKKQVSFGPRVCNTPAHEKCATWLISKFKSYSPDVIIQKGQVKAWDGTNLNFKNIICSFNVNAVSRIMICSHWDSRPYADHDPDPANRNKAIDGANDGASGVGVLLEMAQQMSIENPKTGVDLICLDAEDYGPPQDKTEEAASGDWWGLGSQYWAKNPHKPGYSAKYGILLDMVGAPNATFRMEHISMEYAADIVKGVWTVANRIGYSGYFLFEEGNPINDDHLYINKYLKLPTIDIIHLDPSTESGFYPYWHTTKDNMASIDPNTLKAVGQTLLTVIYNEQ